MTKTEIAMEKVVDFIGLTVYTCALGILMVGIGMAYDKFTPGLIENAIDNYKAAPDEQQIEVCEELAAEDATSDKGFDVIYDRCIESFRQINLEKQS